MSIRTPSELTNAKVKEFEQRDFSSIFLITGVELNSKDEQISRTSLDDFATYPYNHGFLTAIDSILHVHDRFRNYIWQKYPDNDPGPLELVFSSTITEGFEKLGQINPVCWIHLGHGHVDTRCINPDEEDEWIEYEYEDVPMLSDGSEERSFIDTKEICKIIHENEGTMLFCALPLCFSKQSGDALESVNKISLIHAIYDGKVNTLNEFSDGDTEKQRVESNFQSWSDWVNAMRKATRRY